MRRRFLPALRLSALAAMIVAATLASSIAGTKVRIFTSIGNVDLELYDQDKPVTVENFLKYVTAQRYNGTFAHRLEPGFVLQAGGYGLTYSDAAGFGVPHIQTYPPIENEYATGTVYSNTYGTVAMAKVDGDPDSATSEWFINLGNNSSNLDNQNGGFTVFGHVIAGFDVLERLKTTFADADTHIDAQANIFGASNIPVAGITSDNVSPAQDLLFIAVSLLDASTPQTSEFAPRWPVRQRPTPTPSPTPKPLPVEVPAITVKAGVVKTRTASAKITGTATSSVVRVEWRLGPGGRVHRQWIDETWTFKVGGLRKGKNFVYLRGVDASGRLTSLRKIKVLRK